MARKPYDGAPEVGIDENNALCLDGEPFFPVTPWLLNKIYLETWKGAGYINSLFGVGYYDEHNVATWTDYLDAAAAEELPVIGPMRWEDEDGLPPSLDRDRRRRFARNADIASMANYVSSTRDHPGLLAWMWWDEPEMGGGPQRVPPQVLGAWTFVGHWGDAQHPAATNFGGYRYLPYYGDYGMDFDYLNSASFFGGRKHFSIDVVGFDIYPLEYRFHVSLNDPDRGPIDLYAAAIDLLVANNYDLIPTMSFIEVCDISADRGTPGPTYEQVLMEAWLNVVHGVKAINWLHYFEYDTIQYDAMAEFTDQITRLAPVVLGPEPDVQVTDDANVAANRVDTMVRYHDGDIYVFAVRVTEPDPIPGALYTIPEPATIDVSFLLDISVGGLAEVVDEGRTVTVIGGAFSDTFARNAVHIYRIPLSALELRGHPGNETFALDWTVNASLPVTTSWHIDYYTTTLTAPFTATDPLSTTRAYTLTDHVTNYEWYTVTLHALVDSTSFLSDTVHVMPTDKFVYLPLVLKTY